MKLTDDARNWWKMWSVRLAAVFAAFAAAVVAAPELLLGLLLHLHERLRPLAIVATFVVAFIVPTLTRLTRQAKLEDKPDGNPEA